jgi:hypothetical protein
MPERMFGVEGVGMDVIQAPKLEPRTMRYEHSDYERAAIKPLLPNELRGVPCVDDRHVLNGIFWALRSGAPWRDLPLMALVLHDLLQSLRSRAKGWRLGSNLGCAHHRSRSGRADDRHIDRAGAPARGLYRRQQRAANGLVARWN